MDIRKRTYIGRIVALLMAAPIVVFVALLTLLYLPPVQHWAVEKAARVASDATGMDIRVGRIRLVFPLDLAVENVVVSEGRRADSSVTSDGLRADTLAAIGELRTGVAVWPLLRGQVEVSGISLTRVMAHTGGLIPSVEVDGQIGQLHLRGADIDLATETVEVKSLTWHETDVALTLHADTTSRDTISSPVRWKFFLRRAKIGRVNFSLQMPADTMRLTAGWKQAQVREAAVDLGTSAYGASHLALNDGFVTYDADAQLPAKGFDPRHLSASEMEVAADSILYQGEEMRAIVHQLALNERSGFRLTHTEGDFQMDSSGIRLHHLRTKAASSYAQADISLPWEALRGNGKERMKASVEGEVSLADVDKLYPLDIGHHSPLHFRIGLQGNMRRLLLDTLAIRMDSVATMSASGEASHLTDDERRTGSLTWKAVAHDLNTLAPLMTTTDRASVAIPQGLRAKGTVEANKTRYEARLHLHEQEGWLAARGHYDTRSLEYALGVRADSLPLHRFLPKDSIGHLTARIRAVGRGTDPYAPATHLAANVHVDSLQYGTQLISHIDLKASLEEHRAHVALDSRNPLLEMAARVDALLHRDSLKAKATVEVESTQLPPLQMMEAPLEATAQVDMRPHSLHAQVTTGDFLLKLNSANGLDSLIGGITSFVQTLQAQLAERSVDIGQAKRLLPDMNLTLNTGKENPIAHYLRHTSGISMEEADVEILASPASGLSVNGNVHRLRTDSLELDTIRLEMTTMKDTTLVANLAVSNAPGKRKPVFTANLGGVVGKKTSSVQVHFHNGKGELGLELGARARLEEEGMRLTFFPERPTIGFRQFTLNDSNYVFLSDSGRIAANVRVLDNAGTGLRLYSSPNEEALQDLTVDLTRLHIEEILTVLPYAPDIAGVLNTELHYVKSIAASTFSGSMQVNDLAYGGYALGTVGMEAAYLPTSRQEHLVSVQLTHDDTMIATLDGKYRSDGASDEPLTADIHLEQFPVEMANAFMPRDIVTLDGWLSGELSVKGEPSAPRINGEVRFDSVQVHSPLYALDLRVDKTPINVTDNHLTFDNFPIYAKGKNPFTLTGSVDLGDFSHMRADLQMKAVEYELLNAKKNRNSVLHGRVFVSLFSTIKGELTSPVIRGRMEVLGNTDATYVLKESPLTVEDRLGSMVTFTNFNDTLVTPKKEKEVTLGGVDMLLDVHIDQGAQVEVDLGSDNYVEVQGGGDLAMQYTPQGDLLLTGRYTLTNGEMKYSLPVIPLKTFKIASGSYVEFTGDPTNPYLNIAATERVRTSVTEENSSRYVNFDVGVSITNSLDNMGVAFTLEAPEDVSLQNQLAAMSAEERGKLAVTMLVTGMYAGGQGSGGGFNTGNALNSFLQSEISSIAGSALKTVDVSIGVEGNYAADGTTQGGTDYSFRFAKRFWNNRLSVIIGGRISTGNEAVAEGEGNSFIDDISLEWRLDDSGTRYVKLFHTRNYESILEGEIIETGVGLVLRRKVNKLGELFIFRRKE